MSVDTLGVPLRNVTPAEVLGVVRTLFDKNAENRTPAAPACKMVMGTAGIILRPSIQPQEKKVKK